MINVDIKTKVENILEEMERVYKNDKRPWVIGYSGGKDSTTVVQLVFTMLMQLPPEERHKDVYVVSSDTLIENPIVLGFLKHNANLINEGAKKANIPLYSHMVHPDYNNSYWANVIGKGLPTPTSIRFRWCTDKLKIKPSNTFIEEKVKEIGEVVILLGVRKAESIARSIRIKNREIEGYLMTPHVSLANTYVYNPIVELTKDDVWKFLLSNDNPWGANNKDLFTIYSSADGGECPFTITNDEITPSCGNSRMGCWICTVVSKDKSLTGFIQSGETWLQPLLDFREWIVSIRNKHEYRMQYRRDGNHYYKKLYLDNLPLLDDYTIDPDYLFSNDDGEAYVDLNNCQSDIKQGIINDSDNKDKIYLELLPLLNVDDSTDIIIDKSKIQNDDKGNSYINVIGYGPFNFKARQVILRKLLELQYKINQEYEDIDLITIEELEAIDKIWDEEEDLTRRTLVDIYNEIMHKRLPWDEYKRPMFDENTRNVIDDLCTAHDIDKDLINKLLIETNKYKHFTYKTALNKSITKILNQRHLHKEIVEEIENDN